MPAFLIHLLREIVKIVEGLGVSPPRRYHGFRRKTTVPTIPKYTGIKGLGSGTTAEPTIKSLALANDGKMSLLSPIIVSEVKGVLDVNPKNEFVAPPVASSIGSV